MNMYRKPLLLTLLLLLFPMVAFANVIWPALIVEQKIISPPIILISLVLEYFFFKYLFTLNIITALYYTLVTNTISTLCGVVLIPFSGILWEITLGSIIIHIFGWGTFNPIAYISVPILGGAINAFLELLTIRIIWKQKLSRRTYVLTWGINVVTIALAGIIAYIQYT